jgi:hypothetical protein
LGSLKFPAEKKAEAWSAYQKLTDEQKKKLAQAEVTNKKRTATSSPTLQQSPIAQKSTLAPALPASSVPAQESPAPSTNPDNNTSNP